jgi:GNAT superfamily N-acetyltransferase
MGIKLIGLNMKKNYRFKIMNKMIYYLQLEDWGDSILIMEKHGKAFSRIYWYNDDDSTVYLSSLSVSPNARRKGLGTKMQEIREEIGKNRGATISCLSVKKDTWMHDWYLRRGYEDWKDCEDDESRIWMRKNLNI